MQPDTTPPQDNPSAVNAKILWENILTTMVKQGATEARLKPESAPEIRLKGMGKKGDHDFNQLSGQELQNILQGILEKEMLEKLAQTGSLVFIYEIEEVGTFRCTVFDQPSGPSIIVWPPSREEMATAPSSSEPEKPVSTAEVAKQPMSLPLDEIQALKQVVSRYRQDGHGIGEETISSQIPLPKVELPKEEVVSPKRETTRVKKHGPLPEYETTKKHSSVQEHEPTKELEKYLEAMARFEASDFHLKVATRPTYRIGGQLRDIDKPAMSNEEIRRMLYEILTPAQIKEFEENWDVDFAYGVRGAGRFRINAFIQRGTISIAARRITSRIPTFEELHLPARIIKKICTAMQGLVLLCGVTGCGKSTTLAAMIDHINRTRRAHIITLEDPIEYLYQDNKCLIAQREIGIDCKSFAEGLRRVLRQDPDIILVGELRDPETFATALSATETGHLVFGTVHSSNVVTTIGRILDLFPSNKRDMIRTSLSFNLQALICQRLLPCCKPGVKVVPMNEILIVNPTARKVIKEGNDSLLADIVRGDDDMMDFNQCLHDLIKRKLVTVKDAMEFSPKPEQLKMALKGIVLSEDRKILNA